MNFTAKTVAITGGNAGIGFATSLLFAKEKAKIIVVDLNETINEELRLKLATLGVEFQYYSCDVSNFLAVEKTFKAITDKHKIDILVNNAGILGPNIKTENYPLDIFDSVIDVNVKGVYYVMKSILPHFVAQNSGVIINTASVAGHVGMKGHIAYSASKHAVVGMTKTVALEYAKNNIRVNAVCPGFTQTSMLDTAEVDQEYLQTLKFVTPLRRFGEPSEIASAILFLASENSSFMTGQSLILDGGLTAQ